MLVSMMMFSGFWRKIIPLVVALVTSAAVACVLLRLSSRWRWTTPKTWRNRILLALVSLTHLDFYANEVEVTQKFRTLMEALGLITQVVVFFVCFLLLLFLSHTFSIFTNS